MEKKSNYIGETRLAEIRAMPMEQGGQMILEGYAIRFDSPATHKYGDYEFTEVIKRGALDGAVMDDVPLRYNHNDSFMIMARTRNKSLELIVDNEGLKIRAVLSDTQSNRDVYKNVTEGLIDKMSFAFTVAKDGDSCRYEGNHEYREITAIERLYDVSVVDMPFYDTTSVYARSAERLESHNRQLESFDLRKRKILLTEKYKEV